MPVNLSLKNVPDNVYARLKKRAQLHRRSMNSEIIEIIDHSLRLERDQEQLWRDIDEFRSQLNFTTTNDEIRQAILEGRK